LIKAVPKRQINGPIGISIHPAAPTASLSNGLSARPLLPNDWTHWFFTGAPARPRMDGAFLSDPKPLSRPPFPPKTTYTNSPSLDLVGPAVLPFLPPPCFPKSGVESPLPPSFFPTPPPPPCNPDTIACHERPACRPSDGSLLRRWERPASRNISTFFFFSLLSPLLIISSTHVRPLHAPVSEPPFMVPNFPSC